MYCNVVVFFIESKVEEGGHRESLTHLHVTARPYAQDVLKKKSTKAGN